MTCTRSIARHRQSTCHKAGSSGICPRHVLENPHWMQCINRLDRAIGTSTAMTQLNGPHSPQSLKNPWRLQSPIVQQLRRRHLQASMSCEGWSPTRSWKIPNHSSSCAPCRERQLIQDSCSWLNHGLLHTRLALNFVFTADFDHKTTSKPTIQICVATTDCWVEFLSIWQRPPNKTAIMKMNQGSEGQARSLKNHIAELESRLAHPQHWTEGENNQNAEKLRQLVFERQRLISIQDTDLIDFN